MARTRTPVNDVVPGRRYAFDADQEHSWFPDITEPDFWEIAEELWDYTVVGSDGLYNLYSACRYVFENGVEGDIVECGVFMGGSVMFVAEMCKRHRQERQLFALDTFAGFVRRTEKDVDWHGEAFGAPDENPRSQRQAAEDNIRSIGFRDDLIHVVEGDVHDTLPALAVEQIAILRLDTDTYDTTLVELEHLYDRVVSGGVVILDDYGWSLGQRTAADEFLAGRNGRGVFLIRFGSFGRAFVKP